MAVFGFPNPALQITSNDSAVGPHEFLRVIDVNVCHGIGVEFDRKMGAVRWQDVRGGEEARVSLYPYVGRDFAPGF